MHIRLAGFAHDLHDSRVLYVDPVCKQSQPTAFGVEVVPRRVKGNSKLGCDVGSLFLFERYVPPNSASA